MLLIGRRYRPLLARPFARLGMEVCWLPDNPQVDSRLAGHADLSVFAKGRTVVAARGIWLDIVKYLTNRGYAVLPAAREQGAAYPLDVGLCVCQTETYTICNRRTVDPALKPFLSDPVIDTAQGYSRCAVVAADSRSIICADPGICRAAKKAGLEVLQITPGYIALSGFAYGFAGGAFIRLQPDTLACTGTLDGHPDQDAMLAFLHSLGQTVLFLTEKPVFDVGGGIYLP